MTYNSATSQPLNGVFATFQDMRAAFEARRAHRATFNRTFRELSQMSDRDLMDIGLSRGDIPHIAAEAARTAK